jgi:hypothetical protein
MRRTRALGLTKPSKATVTPRALQQETNKDWEPPTLAEQGHKHHKSTDPCGQTKKQHKVVAEVKRHPRPLRMGGTNIAL